MNEDRQPAFSESIRVMQIIVFALTTGPLFFLAIVCFLVRGDLRSAFDGMPILTLVGLVMAGSLVVVRAIVQQAFTSNARREIMRQNPGTAGGKPSAESADRVTGQLLGLYQTRMIIGSAMFEGAAFFLLVTHMIERSPWSLAVAVVLIVGVASHFPTVGRVGRWIDQQQALLEEERQLEPNR
jgi:hypothetical protein